jgi:hypothetical protein
MKVFSISGDSRATEMWGPTASVSVRIAALDAVVGGSWLLEGVNIGAKEIVDVRQCFNDVAYIYALGNDQRQCSITLQFVVFIGTRYCRGKSNTKAIQSGLNSYKTNRVSQKTAPQPITIGSFSTKGWLIACDIGQFDPVRGLCHAVATFIMQLEK